MALRDICMITIIVIIIITWSSLSPTPSFIIITSGQTEPRGPCWQWKTEQDGGDWRSFERGQFFFSISASSSSPLLSFNCYYDYITGYHQLKSFKGDKDQLGKWADHHNYVFIIIKFDNHRRLGSSLYHMPSSYNLSPHLKRRQRSTCPSPPWEMSSLPLWMASPSTSLTGEETDF